MSIQKTEGIILRRQEIRETSLMLTVCTRQLGKVQGLVKGVRGARAAVPWYLEPMTLQSMVLYERRRSAWTLISSCDLVDAFDPIRRDFSRTAYAAYALDLVDAFTGVNDPHPEIFHLLRRMLTGLGRTADPPVLLRYLEIHLLKMSGLLPESGRIPLSVEGREAFQGLLELSPEAAVDLELPPSVEWDLRQKLQGLLRVTLERELKSRRFLMAAGLESTRPAAAAPRRVAPLPPTAAASRRLESAA